jgi:glycosyltransferase involved in cell wall biosynthesis
MYRVSTSPANGPEPAVAEATVTLPTTQFRVAFCGPIGARGKPAGGGYESANRRNCDALARRGVQVVELPYPKTTPGKALRLWRYAASFLKAASFLLTRRADYDLLHLTPLNLHFAYAESVLLACARLAGKPVLLDVRAGTFTRSYQSGGAAYRRTIDRNLRLASRVAVEGQQYIPFVRPRTQAPVFYLPNYVDEPALRSTPAPRQVDGDSTVRLIYFGRLVAEKGVETAVAALSMLLERGHAVALEFIGDGPADFMAQMRQRCASLPVTWTPSLPVPEILERAAQAHFFVFASRHDGEGHSNALNEAMSVGLVPICSEQGFSGDVVANAGVVLPVGASAADYAQAISKILVEGRWARLSQRASARVRAVYSEEATLPTLRDHYRGMLGDSVG